MQVAVVMKGIKIGNYLSSDKRVGFEYVNFQLMEFESISINTAVTHF